jgi:inner membrane protein
MNGSGFSTVRRSPLFRLGFLAFLVILLQFPILAIARLVQERQMRRDSAVAEVSSKWGRAQSLTGPAIVVPYVVRRTVVHDGKPVVETDESRLTFLPESVRVAGRLDPDTRRRGIFSIPVYALELTVDGAFAPPDWSALGIAPGDVDWSRAEFSVGVADVRAIQERTSLTWQGREVEFLPGAGALVGVASGLHAPIAAGGADAAPWTFSFPLRLHGSSAVTFTPAGKQTDVRIASAWPSPSFVGEWLPIERRVTDQGFTARWAVPYLGRNVPQAWTRADEQGAQLAGTVFGLNLIETVDSYRMAERSLKYATLFLLMTLLAVWIAEVLAGIAVHPIQSLLLCTALCMFYLLELSLSEHLGFGVAYLVASTAITIMIAAYGRVALGAWRRALGLGAGVAALYGYLYVVLSNEDFALLVGSIGLFVLLAVVMYVTRRVNWDRLEAPGTTAPGTTAPSPQAGTP